MDLNAILWTTVVGIPVLLWFSYWGIGILYPLLEWLKPKSMSRQPVQRTLTEFMHDRYPYEKKWVIPEDLYKEVYPELTQEERDLLETQEIEEDDEDN